MSYSTLLHAEHENSESTFAKERAAKVRNFDFLNIIVYNKTFYRWLYSVLGRNWIGKRKPFEKVPTEDLDLTRMMSL